MYEVEKLRCDSCLWPIRLEDAFFSKSKKVICSRCKEDVEKSLKEKRY